MPSIEDAIKNIPLELPGKRAGRGRALSKSIKLLSSIRLGIYLMGLFLFLCFLGMVVMQQNVRGFDAYYNQLSEPQRAVFGILGLFDIYHAWYFNGLILLIGINIMLASFDRFPKTLRFVSNPNLAPSGKWLSARQFKSSLESECGLREAGEEIKLLLREKGWKNCQANEKAGKRYIFAEKNSWNRFGAYYVHAALLIILFGSFLSSYFGYSANIALQPGKEIGSLKKTALIEGEVSEVLIELPFSIYCRDIEQKLIDPGGTLEASNTLDWVTHIELRGNTGGHQGMVALNRPFDYQGYRFFHSDFSAIGKARSIRLLAEYPDGLAFEANIARGETQPLPGGGLAGFVDFRTNFSEKAMKQNESPASYRSPAAVLQLKMPGNPPETIYAQLSGGGDISRSADGISFRLLGFEKVSEQHILSVQRDPGVNFLYAGFVLLIPSLGAVFLFSHRRIWFMLEEKAEGGIRLKAAADSNRGQAAFETEFDRVVEGLRKKLGHLGG